MSIVEHGDEGALHVPADLLPTEKPHIEYVLDVYDGLIVLRPADDPEPMWKNPDPAAGELLDGRKCLGLQRHIPLEFLTARPRLMASTWSIRMFCCGIGPARCYRRGAIAKLISQSHESVCAGDL